ncbi:MAG: hypothetical protein M3041_12035 [Acidobacteriota bacterium]|nr:hypothetical protein [Acidobacteriota bacterium]
MMRRVFVFAAILAIVAIPMAVGNIGFCRSMPCCPPHLGAYMADAHQPDCCNTTNCEQAPAAGRDYTSAKQADYHAPVLLAVAILPTVRTFTGRPQSALNAVTAAEAHSLPRRIALLSIFLI